MSDRMTCAEAVDLATLWASRGVPAFPIAMSWDDVKKGVNKTPLTDHGFYDATTDPAELDRMFNARSPKPGEVWGVGLWPGPAGYAVVDVDIKGGAGGDDTWAELTAKNGDVDTYSVVTASGGWHVWGGKGEAHVPNGDAPLGPGIEIRSDSGYAVAPGVFTPWGRWAREASSPPWPPDRFPAWVVDRIAATNGHSGPRGRWQPLDRTSLHPADLAALEALEHLGGHDPYIGGDGALMIVRPGKVAGGSASIGHIAPGVAKVFSSNWPPLRQDGRYEADELAALAETGTTTGPEDLLAGVRNGAWLDAQTFPPLRYHLPGIIPEGSSLLVGPPKIGKSWFVLSLGLAAAAGGTALGLPIDARPVLYLALEDGHRRLQSRCRILLGTDRIPEAFDYLVTIQPGTITSTIEAWLARHPGAQPLVILDTLGKVMPPALMGETTYQRDYRVGGTLKRAVDEQPGSALVTNHHDRKAGAEDFVDRVSGSNGLAGSADTIIVLARPRHDTAGLIEVTGRDISEGEYAVTFDGPRGLWSLCGGDLSGAAIEARQRRAAEGLDERSRAVIAYVTEHPEGVRWGDVKRDLGEDEARYLSRLYESGRIARPSRGLYRPLSVVSVVSVSTDPSTTGRGVVSGLSSETGQTDTTDTLLGGEDDAPDDPWVYACSVCWGPPDHPTTTHKPNPVPKERF